MSTAFAIRTILEFIVGALLIYGFIHEEKVIAFEQSVKRIVIGNIRHYVRVKNHQNAIARGMHLHLQPSPTRPTNTPTNFVA